MAMFQCSHDSKQFLENGAAGSLGHVQCLSLSCYSCPSHNWDNIPPIHVTHMCQRWTPLLPVWRQEQWQYQRFPLVLEAGFHDSGQLFCSSGKTRNKQSATCTQAQKPQPFMVILREWLFPYNFQLLGVCGYPDWVTQSEVLYFLLLRVGISLDCFRRSSQDCCNILHRLIRCSSRIKENPHQNCEYLENERCMSHFLDLYEVQACLPPASCFILKIDALSSPKTLANIY